MPTTETPKADSQKTAHTTRSRARASERIVVITELFLPTKGGTAVWFDEVYRRLGNKEHHVITAKVAGDTEHDSTHSNSIHRLSLQRVSWLKPESLWMYLNLLMHSIWYCLRYSATSVHAGRVLPEGAIAVLCGKLFSIPSVIYAHGEEITTWRQKNKFKAMVKMYQQCDHVIANSEFTQQELLKLGIKQSKIRLIHPGVNVERFQPSLPCADLKQQIQLQNDEFLLLSVGRLSRRKGFDTVIKALAHLKQQGIKARYALIGIGEDLHYLTELSQQLGVAEQVHFLGHVAVDDLPRWYNACNLFVMPNREVNGDTEGFGMVFIEAAACGKTAISGNIGGPPNAVLHEKTGLNVDGTDEHNLTRAILRLIENPELTQRLAQQARQRATQELSWQAVAQQTKEFLD
ncbi:glycosyltransferase family 4 protein [Motilimonas pumila]|uniref:Glycosyltransferase family 4 protein n=1 Tax=Motilimonas pumila TaxID=2303987 RepID=A0A418YJ16_9GAMM|nr:glycosyltransferase family 4 protein [Motilimonas pumila]RJG50643.1 glycosyltransferase family 4 protein [Motilimonas pumila]